MTSSLDDTEELRRRFFYVALGGCSRTQVRRQLSFALPSRMATWSWTRAATAEALLRLAVVGGTAKIVGV